MIVKCSYCNSDYKYKKGLVEFNKHKNHYCSVSCKNNGIKTHGMSTLSDNDKDKIEEYKRYRLWVYAKKRAKKSDIPFNIEPEDIPNIPEYCPVLGIYIKNGIKSSHDNSPSLDKIIPELGYVKDNIRIISHRANRIKNDATVEELKLVYRDLLKITK